MYSDSVELMIEKILSSSLEHVHIHSVQYTEESASKFTSLERNQRLVSLHFKNCASRGLNSVISYVAKALHKNDTLRILGISSPEDTSLTFVSPLEEVDKSRSHLLNECIIDNDSIQALSEMLKVNKTLETLAIISTKLSKDNVLSLCDALQGTLRNLVLDTELIKIHPRVIPSSHTQLLSMYNQWDSYPIRFSLEHRYQHRLV